VVLDVPDRFEATISPATAWRLATPAGAEGEGATTTQTATRTERQRPSFGITLFSVCCPSV